MLRPGDQSDRAEIAAWSFWMMAADSTPAASTNTF
jgi:hypothetical protein